MDLNLRQKMGLLIWWTEGTKAYKDKRWKNVWLSKCIKPAPAAEELGPALQTIKGCTIQNPIEVEDSPAPTPPHGGISNTSNTCYAAALMQAFSLLSGDQGGDGPVGEAFSTFIGRLRQSRWPSSLEASEMQTLIRTFLRHGWGTDLGSLGDPQELLLFLQTHLRDAQEWQVRNTSRQTATRSFASLEQPIRSIPDGTPLQSVLLGTFPGAKQRVELIPNKAPSYFILTLGGRSPLGQSRRDDRRISFSPHIVLPDTERREQRFVLSSVIVYEPGHYCLFLPNFSANGTISSWAAFNDSAVSLQPNTPALTSTIESQGYMYFYQNYVERKRTDEFLFGQFNPCFCPT